jgi:hypothetical protein
MIILYDAVWHTAAIYAGEIVDIRAGWFFSYFIQFEFILNFIKSSTVSLKFNEKIQLEMLCGWCFFSSWVYKFYPGNLETSNDIPIWQVNWYTCSA